MYRLPIAVFGSRIFADKFLYLSWFNPIPNRVSFLFFECTEPTDIQTYIDGLQCIMRPCGNLRIVRNDSVLRKARHWD